MPETPQQRPLLHMGGYSMSPAADQQGQEPPGEVPSAEEAEMQAKALEKKRKRKEQTREAHRTEKAKRQAHAAWFVQKEAVEAAAVEATRKHEDLLQKFQHAQQQLLLQQAQQLLQTTRHLHEQQLQLSDSQKKEKAAYSKGRAAAGADQQSELQQAEKVVLESQ